MFTRLFIIAVATMLTLTGCGANTPLTTSVTSAPVTEEVTALDAYGVIHAETLVSGMVAVRVYANRFETLKKGNFNKWVLVDTVMLSEVARVDFKSGFFSGKQVIVTLKNGNFYTWQTKNERLREVILGLMK